MSRRTQRMARAEAAHASTGAIVQAGASPSTGVQAFAFGDPEPVLDRRAMFELFECTNTGRWYEPPIPFDGLARAFGASPHHSSAIILKRNQLAKSFAPSDFLARKDFTAAAQDLLVFGNAYFEVRRNKLGGVLRLERMPAKFMRRGLIDGQYWYVTAREATAYAPGTVVQVSLPDINQELYGVPEYISALQSALLNESATLFRRKYYLNGSHAGFIMYVSGEFANNDVDNMREALKASKGPGNFRNLFVQSPKGSENGIKIIPIAEVGAKDEFLGIKGATRDDVLAAHRVPPQLLGIVPAQGSSGFGNPLQAADMFHMLEIEPLQAKCLELNDEVGADVVAFEPYALLAPPTKSAA